MLYLSNFLAQFEVFLNSTTLCPQVIMTFNLMQEEVSQRVRNVGRNLGIIKDDDEYDLG